LPALPPPGGPRLAAPRLPSLPPSVVLGLLFVLLILRRAARRRPDERDNSSSIRLSAPLFGPPLPITLFLLLSALPVKSPARYRRSRESGAKGKRRCSFNQERSSRERRVSGDAIKNSCPFSLPLLLSLFPLPELHFCALCILRRLARPSRSEISRENGPCRVVRASENAPPCRISFGAANDRAFTAARYAHAHFAKESRALQMRIERRECRPRSWRIIS